VQWFSLQNGNASAQLEGHRGVVADYVEDCADLLDTAALVANLDLVISVDTAVAHLAGALGKPVWLLNRFGSEWRWGLAREDTPWYPTMRIFREPARDAWDVVIERVAAELKLR
jgi:ADP-heptose:LPS heptosyltransferase